MTGRLFRRFIAMGFFTALILLSANVAFAAADPAAISSTTQRQGRPDTHGNIVVWKRLIVPDSNEWDIYMYNLASHNGDDGEQVVTSDPGKQINPMTNGFVVVWEDWSMGQGDIYIKDLFLGVPRPLVTGPGNQGVLGISGNMVVYVDDHGGTNNDVYAIDVNNGNIQPVCTTTADQWQPRISGSRVVWQDNRNGNYDIFMKELPDGQERQLTTDSGDDTAPDISGDIVVWKTYRGGQYDIHWMNVQEKDPIDRAITNDAAEQMSPAVSGDMVVWMDHRNNDDQSSREFDIYTKDLTKDWDNDNVNMLAGGSTYQAYPSIDRETIVWEEYGAGNYSIWKTTVPDTTPPAISSLTPADGLHTGCGSPGISASYTDNRIGVDAGSVRLTVDGEDVTATATVTGSSVSYQPDSLAEGQHSATVTVADQSGNSRSASWQFYTSKPSMHLNVQPAFWASYSDYENRELSVSYQFLNATTDTPAFSVEILASPATAGVILASPVPAAVGDIAPGSYGSVVLKYLVPDSTASFRTSLYAGGADACGATWYFPGPPPGE